MTARLLPEGFDDFEPFVDWALPSANDRSAKRLASSPEEIRRLYDLGMNRARDALAYLDQLPLEDLPPDAERLLRILFSLAEVRPQVEDYHGKAPQGTIPPHRFTRTVHTDLI